MISLASLATSPLLLLAGDARVACGLALLGSPMAQLGNWFALNRMSGYCLWASLQGGTAFVALQGLGWMLLAVGLAGVGVVAATSVADLSVLNVPASWEELAPFF